MYELSIRMTVTDQRPGFRSLDGNPISQAAGSFLSPVTSVRLGIAHVLRLSCIAADSGGRRFSSRTAVARKSGHAAVAGDRRSSGLVCVASA